MLQEIESVVERGFMSLHQRLNKLQKTAVERACELLESDGRCVIIMCTGTGKTITGSKIIQAHRDHKILWLTQMHELISQTREELQKIFGEKNVGLYQDKRKSLREQIIVASVQTIEKDKYLKKIPRDLFDLMVVDEAHHAAASTWKKVIDHFHAKKLGL